MASIPVANLRLISPLASLPAARRPTDRLAAASPAVRRRRRLVLRSPAVVTAAGAAAGAGGGAGVPRLADVELVAVPKGPGEVLGRFPAAAGVYGVYDDEGSLQFVGMSRNVAGSVAAHAKFVPELCSSVKVGIIAESEADKTTLTNAWKAWMEEHIEATGQVPPGNETGNNTWVRRPVKKSDMRLTPGRHVQLTVPLEELIDKLVKENKVVAFIKGSRHAPQCGFSQRVIGILDSHGVDYESVDVLDEEYNSGLRETLKMYSNWPTFPQVFVGGELLGGCDIISSMAEKGELATLLKK